MNHQTRPQFRFKPGSFWRHNITCIGNRNQLVHRYRKKSQCYTHFAVIHPSFQFTQSSYSADKIDSFITPQVFNAQDFIQYQI